MKLKSYIENIASQNNNTIKLLEASGFPNAVIIYENIHKIPLYEICNTDETIIYREILLNGVPYKETTLFYDGNVEWSTYNIIENRKNDGEHVYDLVLRTDDTTDYDMLLAEHYRLYEKTRELKYLSKIGYDFYNLGDTDIAKEYFDFGKKHNCEACITYLNFLYL